MNHREMIAHLEGLESCGAIKDFSVFYDERGEIAHIICQPSQALPLTPEEARLLFAKPRGSA